MSSSFVIYGSVYVAFRLSDALCEGDCFETFTLLKRDRMIPGAQWSHRIVLTREAYALDKQPQFLVGVQVPSNEEATWVWATGAYFEAVDDARARRVLDGMVRGVVDGLLPLPATSLVDPIESVAWDAAAGVLAAREKAAAPACATEN